PFFHKSGPFFHKSGLFFPQKWPLFPQKWPLFPQKLPLLPQKWPLFSTKVASFSTKVASSSTKVASFPVTKAIALPSKGLRPWRWPWKGSSQAGQAGRAAPSTRPGCVPAHPCCFLCCLYSSTFPGAAFPPLFLF
uniref:Uncharacterized protein n=1 Tax=Cairina moschata TaxID=8855 RepID=A0A8C3CMA1_CAIMO